MTTLGSYQEALGDPLKRLNPKMPSSAAIPEILIIDDLVSDARLTQEALRNGTDGNHIHLTKDLREALTFLRREPPFAEAPLADVILIAVNPPSPSGREAFEEIRRTRYHPPVIILARGTEEPVSRYLHYGAADYIVKNDLHPLEQAITQVVAIRAPLRKLSPRQVEVLRLIGEGLATRDIARQLEVSGKTVEAHRAELMRRLEIRTVAGLVRYALRACLVELDGE